MHSARASSGIPGPACHLRRRGQPGWRRCGQPSFQLPDGMIHGDAHRAETRSATAPRGTRSPGRRQHRAPARTDLIPTLRAPRFGLPSAERGAVIAANGAGHPIPGRTPGPCVISGNCPPAPLSCATATDNNAAQRGLQVRLRSLHAGDTGNEYRSKVHKPCGGVQGGVD
jgi:hypothetical protein